MNGHEDGDGTGTGVEANEGTQDGNGDGSGDGDGNESSRGDGNEDGNGNEDGIGEGGGESKKRKKSHKNCRRDQALSFRTMKRHHLCRQGVTLAGHPTVPFARPGASTRASHRGVNRALGTGRSERG